MNKRLILCFMLAMICTCQPAFSNTNDKPEHKTYIVPRGAKIIYPDGTIFRVSFGMWLLEYKYGIGLRTDAGLWIDNKPIYEKKIANRDNLITTLNSKLTNRIMFSLNLEMINKYNLGYMETLNNIFGPPEKRIGTSNWKFVLGFSLGSLFTIGVCLSVGYAIKQYHKD